VSDRSLRIGSVHLAVQREALIAYRATAGQPWQALTRFGLDAVVAILDAADRSQDSGLEVSQAARHLPRRWAVSLTDCPVAFDQAWEELKRVFERVHCGVVESLTASLIREGLLRGNVGTRLILTEQSDASWPAAQRGPHCAVHLVDISDLGPALAALHRVATRQSPAVLRIHGQDDMQVDALDLLDKVALRAFLEEHERRLDQLEYCRRAGLLPHCRIDLTALLGDVEPVVDF